MRRWIPAAMAATLICCGICSGVSIVKNGSFENDGYIGFVTQADRPEYWCNVSYDQSKFSMYIYNDWSPDGNYSLTMYSNMFTTFGPNDAAQISQSVYLAGVGKLVFDIALYTDSGAWDVNIATARVLIDNNEIWNSDRLQFTAGQFEGEITVDINQNLRDANAHILTLQHRIDVARYNLTQYYSQWDFVRFPTACSLPGDLTGDCKVDINDLAVFTEGWLSPTGPDLNGDGVNNFADFTVVAGLWQTSVDANSSQPSQGKLLDADLNDDGIVEYEDVRIFCGDWLTAGGPCVRADINGDGVINLKDFAKLAGSWQETGSLYIYGW